MKKLLLILSLLLVSSYAKATPYIEGFWDWKNGLAKPTPAIGACENYFQKNAPATQCGTLGFITDKNQDFSLLQAGYSLTGVSKVAPIVGMGFDVLPLVTWLSLESGLPITIPALSASGFSVQGSVLPLYQVPLSGTQRGAFLLQFAGSVKF